MLPPLAYHISWTTYGTWLHGDERGWVERGMVGIHDPDRLREHAVRATMNEAPVFLNPSERNCVRMTIETHCRVREWKLHAVNVRSNHVHVVVTAHLIKPETVMQQLKAWCSRRLNEQYGKRLRWWTNHGSTKWINDETYLLNAIEYVFEKQGTN